jgi:hypothetical protein
MGSNLFRLTSSTLHFNTLRMIKLIGFLLVSICPKEIPLSSFHCIIKSETHVTFPKAINKGNLRGKATNVRLCLENDLNVFFIYAINISHVRMRTHNIKKLAMLITRSKVVCLNVSTKINNLQFLYNFKNFLKKYYILI